MAKASVLRVIQHIIHLMAGGPRCYALPVSVNQLYCIQLSATTSCQQPPQFYDVFEGNPA